MNLRSSLLAFDGDDRSGTVRGVADTLADERIGILLAQARRGARARTAGRIVHRARRSGNTFYAARKFFFAVRVLGIGFVATRFTSLGKRAGCRVDQLGGNFLQEA